MSEATEEVELCRRCGLRPGRERFYNPGTPGEVSFSLAGVTPKFSVKRTVGCDECWAEFVALRETAGYPKPNGDHPPVRSCCGKRHDGAECPDGLVLCQLCFERVPRERLHVLDDGSLEDACVRCVEQEAAATARANRPLWRWWVLLLWGARDWALYTLVWLVGLVLTVVGVRGEGFTGGLAGNVAAVGLVAMGVGGGLFVRWLWEVLS